MNQGTAGVAMLVTVTALALLAGSAPAQIVFESDVAYPVPNNTTVSPRLVADLDGDAAPDLVLGRRWGYGFDVMLNLGDGTFGPATYVSGGDTADLLLADFDEDGTPDLAHAGEGEVRVRLGVGDGTFAAPGVVFTSPDDGIHGLAAGDLDDDGHVDLVVLRGHQLYPLLGGAPRVDLVPGHGDGTFAAATPFTGYVVDQGFAPVDADVVDLDEDGLTDLVLVNTAYVEARLLVFMGRGSGTFGPPTTSGIGTSASAHVAFFLVDGDTAPDMLVQTDLGVGVKLGHGDGTFGPNLIVKLGLPYGTCVADFDGDGDLDVASRFGGSVTVFQGAGNGTFSPGLEFSPCYTAGLDAVDFDGDGRIDIGHVFTPGDDPAKSYVVVRNRTYGAGEPFLDLGHARSDAPSTWNAIPILLAEGTLRSGELFALRIERHMVASSTVWLVLGLDPLLAPFKGGTLVPDPDLVFGPFDMSGVEAITLAGDMPDGVPPGTQLWFQAWFTPDGPGINPAATSGLEATVP